MFPAVMNQAGLVAAKATPPGSRPSAAPAATAAITPAAAAAVASGAAAQRNAGARRELVVSQT